MTFAAVLGQEKPIELLKRGIAETDLPQSLLFVGSEGVGKTTVSLALIQRLFCQNPTADNDACGSCVNCGRVARNEHPDLYRIAPDGDQTKIWQFWTRPGHPAGALETLPFAPVAASHRIYLIEKAETLNEESANSLLKALEEPPPYVRFILCAPSPDSVLQTIRSRCRLIRFAPLPMASVERWLHETQNVDLLSAHTWAAYTQGLPGIALRLSRSPEAAAQRDAVMALAAKIAQSPGIALFRLAEELREIAKPRKGSKSDAEGDEDGERSVRGELAYVLNLLALWYGDLLRARTQDDSAHLLHEDRREAIYTAATKYTQAQIEQGLEQLFLCRRQIERNANPQMATEVLMLKLIPRVQKVQS